jgi:hypothetical protein
MQRTLINFPNSGYTAEGVDTSPPQSALESGVFMCSASKLLVTCFSVHHFHHRTGIITHLQYLYFTVTFPRTWGTIGHVGNFVFPHGTNTATGILVQYHSFGGNLLPRHLNAGHKSRNVASHPRYELVMKAVGRRTFRYVISCALLHSNSAPLHMEL